MPYQASHTGVLGFGVELGALSVGSADPLNIYPHPLALQTVPRWIGYGNVPDFHRSDGSRVTHGVGSVRGVDTTPGARQPGFGAEVKLGNIDFLRFGLRGQGAPLLGSMIGATIGGLPLLWLVGGAADQVNNPGWAQILRSALCSSWSLSFAEGQPVMASLSFMGIAVQESYYRPLILDLLPLPQMGVPYWPFQARLASEVSVMTWHDATFYLNGNPLRAALKSATVHVDNNVRPVGCRPDLGWDNPISRCPVWLIPGQETTTVNLELSQRLNFDGPWQTLALTARDTPYTKQLTVTLYNALPAQQALRSAAPGQLITFSVSGVGRGVSMATTYAS